jgi:ankyrin repeat protein
MGTPLHHAIMGRHYDVAKHLIEAGAELNVSVINFGTPLDVAIHGGVE